MTRAAGRLEGVGSADLLTAGLVASAAAAGAVFSWSAFAYDVLALPAVLIFAALAVATIQRPEIGVAAAFLMVPLGNLRFYGITPWWPVTAWAVFVLLISAWHAFSRRDTRRGAPLLAGSLVLYLAATALAFAVAAGAETARAPLRSLVTGLLLFGATTLSIRERRQIPWVLAGISGGALLAGAYAAYQGATGFTGSEGFVTESGEIVHRVTAGFAHPNALGGFLVQLVPFVIAGLLIARRARPLHAVALAFALAGLYLSFSRSAVVALLLVPFFFVHRRQALLAVPLIAVFVLFAAPDLSRERFATLTESGAEFASRSDIWRTATSVWSEHPVTGVGLGEFPGAYAESRIPGKQFLPNTTLQPPPHAHNVFLQNLSEQGLIGLVALLVVIGLAAHAALTLRRCDDRMLSLVGSAGLAFLTAFLIHNQFDVTPLEGTGIYFWALLGVLSAASGIARGGETEWQQRLARRNARGEGQGGFHSRSRYPPA